MSVFDLEKTPGSNKKTPDRIKRKCRFCGSTVSYPVSGTPPETTCPKRGGTLPHLWLSLDPGGPTQ